MCLVALTNHHIERQQGVQSLTLGRGRLQAAVLRRVVRHQNLPLGCISDTGGRSHHHEGDGGAGTLTADDLRRGRQGLPLLHAQREEQTFPRPGQVLGLLGHDVVLGRSKLARNSWRRRQKHFDLTTDTSRCRARATHCCAGTSAPRRWQRPPRRHHHTQTLGIFLHFGFECSTQCDGDPDDPEGLHSGVVGTPSLTHKQKLARLRSTRSRVGTTTAMSSSTSSSIGLRRQHPDRLEIQRRAPRRVCHQTPRPHTPFRDGQFPLFHLRRRGAQLLQHEHVPEFLECSGNERGHHRHPQSLGGE